MIVTHSPTCRPRPESGLEDSYRDAKRKQKGNYHPSERSAHPSTRPVSVIEINESFVYRVCIALSCFPRRTLALKLRNDRLIRLISSASFCRSTRGFLLSHSRLFAFSPRSAHESLHRFYSAAISAQLGALLHIVRFQIPQGSFQRLDLVAISSSSQLGAQLHVLPLQVRIEASCSWSSSWLDFRFEISHSFRFFVGHASAGKFSAMITNCFARNPSKTKIFYVHKSFEFMQIMRMFVFKSFKVINSKSAQEREIYVRYHSGEKQSSLASLFNVSQSVVRRLIKSHHSSANLEFTRPSDTASSVSGLEV